jgi:hypothetical protein
MIHYPPREGASAQLHTAAGQADQGHGPTSAPHLGYSAIKPAVNQGGRPMALHPEEMREAVPRIGQSASSSVHQDELGRTRYGGEAPPNEMVYRMESMKTLVGNRPFSLFMGVLVYWHGGRLVQSHSGLWGQRTSHSPVLGPYLSSQGRRRWRIPPAVFTDSK